MNIVSVCAHYPSPQAPVRGIFVKQRLRRVAELVDLKVISPRPFFPLLRPYREYDSVDDGVSVMRPRMFYLPGVMKRWDGWWLSHALLPVLSTLHQMRPIDVLDVHFEYPEAVGASRVARYLGIPYVVTVRGLIRKIRRDRRMAGMLYESLVHASHLISVSHDLMSEITALGVSAREVTVIPNAVDASVFSCDPEQCRDPHQLVSVGHVASCKDFLSLVKAFAAACAEIPALKLQIIGSLKAEPRYVRHVRGLVVKLGIQDAVVFDGVKTPQEVATALRSAQAFCLASRWEGCCNAVLEALACGTPAIVTEAGDNAKYVCDGVNGYVVPVGDVTGLGQAIVRSCSRSWDYQGIAQQQIRSWNIVAEEVTRVLARVAQVS